MPHGRTLKVPLSECGLNKSNLIFVFKLVELSTKPQLRILELCAERNNSNYCSCNICNDCGLCTFIVILTPCFITISNYHRACNSQIYFRVLSYLKITWSHKWTKQITKKLGTVSLLIACTIVTESEGGRLGL